MVERVEFSLGGNDHEIERSRLGKHLTLNKVRECLVKAVEEGDGGAIADSLFEYLATPTPNLDRRTYESAPWFEIIMAFSAVQDLNTIPLADQYAILQQYEDDKKSDAVPWDYPGRGGVVWRHLLASSYGWSIEEIDNLWPEQAVELLMEIFSDDADDREFAYRLSEVAYEFDKATKKSRYRPLKRPPWMVLGSEMTKEERKKSILTDLRRDFLPVGEIVRADSDQ